MIRNLARMYEYVIIVYASHEDKTPVDTYIYATPSDAISKIKELIGLDKSFEVRYT